MAQNFTREIKKKPWKIRQNIPQLKKLANPVMKKNIPQIKSGMKLRGTNKRGKKEQKGGQKLSDKIKWQPPISKMSQTIPLLSDPNEANTHEDKISKQLLSKKKLGKAKTDFKE